MALRTEDRSFTNKSNSEDGETTKALPAPKNAAAIKSVSDLMRQQVVSPPNLFRIDIKPVSAKHYRVNFICKHIKATDVVPTFTIPLSKFVYFDEVTGDHTIS